MSKFVVLDLETIPDYSVWTPPPPKKNADPDASPFPPVFAHRPIVIGFMSIELVGHNNLTVHRIDCAPGTADEAQLLTWFSDYLEQHHPTLISWNGRTFDLPVLMHRMLKHGIQAPWYYQNRDTRYRYSENGHLDVMDCLSDYGAAKCCKLDDIAHLCGLPGKLDVSGSKVEEMFKAGQLKAIEDYCLTDVAQTAALWLRFRLLAGHTTKAGFQTTAATLLKAWDADPRLAPLTSVINRDAFLLQAPAPAAPPLAG
jgi:3'-5' exonuclease